MSHEEENTSEGVNEVLKEGQGNEVAEKENVTSDEGVVKKVLKEGEGYPKPREGASLVVKYKGQIDTPEGDGKVFADFQDDERNFNLDDPDVIEGLEEAFTNMGKNEKSRFWIRSDYGYGEKGNPQLGIPRNSNLVYDIEMISFENPKATWELKDHEKIEVGTKKKEQGNELFKRGNTRRAYKVYDRALSLFTVDKDVKDDNKKKIDALKANCYGNMAACKLKDKEWAAVIEKAGKSLELDQKNPKVLYRRAQAYAQNGDNDEAINDLKKALEIEPENEACKQLKLAVQKRISKQRDKEKKLFSGIFNKVNLTEGEHESKAPKEKEEPKAKKEEPKEKKSGTKRKKRGTKRKKRGTKRKKRGTKRNRKKGNAKEKESRKQKCQEVTQRLFCDRKISSHKSERKRTRKVMYSLRN